MVVTDVDNTLMKNYKNLTKEVVKAVKYCNQKGILFTLASGRGTFNLRDIARRIEEQGGEIDYIIGYNGAEVYDNKKHKLIHQDFLEKEEVIEILDVLENEEAYFYLHEEDKYYTKIEKDNQLAYDRLDRGYNVLEFEGVIETPKIYLSIKEGKIKQVYDKLKKELGTRYEVVQSGPKEIDINRKGVGKRTGYVALLGYVGMNNKEVLCFGDSENDLDLLAYATHSVAVENAMECIKEVTKYNTDSCVNHGVYNFIIKNI